jgi:hypothetical protein
MTPTTSLPDSPVIRLAGSLTHQIMLRAQCPVLVVRPLARGEEPPRLSGTDLS